MTHTAMQVRMYFEIKQLTDLAKLILERLERFES